jgi:hypothetical protein
MRNESRFPSARPFLLFTGHLAGWAILGGDVPRMIYRARELLHEQILLLSTTKPLSTTEMECYEKHSEEIHQIVQLLAEEARERPHPPKRGRLV